MRKIVFYIFITLLVSCSTNDDGLKSYKSEGTITGVDPRFCLYCCGGYFIEIEDEVYNFVGEFPNQEKLDLENLPLQVKLNWELKSEGCDNFITISAIEAIN